MPIVLVHGLRVSASMWRPQVNALRAEGRRVLAPDLPGHGRRRGELFTLGGAVATVRAAVDELGGRALVVGLSLGGFVSIAAAAAYPDRVPGLMAVSCSARPVNALAHMYRIPTALLDRLPDRGLAVNSRFHRLTLPADGAAAVLDGGLAMEAARAVIEEVVNLDVLGLLASYPGPVWLINGVRDHFRIHERQFLQACADGRLLTVPRAGHMVNLDQPEVFGKLVADAADVLAARAAAPGETPPDPAASL
ncbi:alpha/beta fold hydrolase [Marinitenerispora sediminis]|uniref:Alpha/beta hydrolase n=1 Tax=Marinitenerispora sediminis TaxID=1931232 RepID=A0A368SZN8_9ACTN|nr:alpha/beta hydrolase [Marinitenerispora sediminis]RCV48169.1 alpha/beta hydrolase [Marinitenerispora sediminis]RCV49222.1 alpha/beta hydrolase [Marinitenerispora sediminis]RCV51555.1 alpha/beta hydrolase [Marinitenerispora sediminis]